jgi:hypothetical protein
MPVTHTAAQPGFYWIVFNVARDASGHRHCGAAPLANSAIEVILCPESRSTPIQQSIRFVGAAAPNAPDRRSQLVIAQRALLVVLEKARRVRDWA